jgi:hypothetical protein
MACPSERELFSLVEGQLEKSVADALRAHCEQCSSCAEIVRQYECLFEPLERERHSDDVVDEAFVASTLEEIRGKSRENDSTSRPSTSFRFAMAAALVVGLAGTLWWVVTPSDETSSNGTMTARGQKSSDWRDLARVDAHFVDDHDSSPLMTGATWKPGQGFAFEHLNGSDQVLFLMAFAVDANSRVHWFCPAWLDPRKNPAGLLVPSGSPRLATRQTVAPVNPASGSFEIYAILSPTRYSVEQIEEMLEQTGPKSKVEELFGDAKVQKWSVNIE